MYYVRRDEILAAVNSDRRNWLNAPWIVAEFYFYRRIVEAFKFLETGYDMFAKQKQVRRTNYFFGNSIGSGSSSRSCSCE